MARFRDADVWRLAKKQHGVVAHWQIARLGVKQRTLYARLRSGEWVRELRTVARMGWADETWLQRVWAVWLWAGPVSAISSLAAATVHGLPVTQPRIIEVTIPQQFVAVCPKRWVRVKRSRLLSRFEVTKVGGLRVTSVARTLVDLAGVVMPEEHEHLVAHAVQAEAVRRESLEWYLSGGRGRRGFGQFRRSVAALSSRADL